MSKPLPMLVLSVTVLDFGTMRSFQLGIDVLHLQTGRLDNEGVEALNQKFWDKFEKADFSNTTFGVSYMKDEDMDQQPSRILLKSYILREHEFLARELLDDIMMTIQLRLLGSQFLSYDLENDFGRKDEHDS